jgi:hypothetical protein
MKNENEVIKVTDTVYVEDGATLTVPELTTISGSVDVREGATLNAPKLKIN